MGIYGEDWASYQSATPSTAGLSFFFTKVTEGLGYENPLWRDQYNHGVAAGLVPGKYHYPHMGNSVQAEGDRFLSLADVRAGDMVALDWEGYDSANQGVPKSQQAAYKDAWLHYVKGKLPHVPVGMYCNTDYWRNVDTTGFFGDFLWIATAGLPAGSPGIQAPWLFHQYSAASVDHDYCHLASRDALRAWVTSFEPAPKPPVPPTPKPTLIGETVLAYLPPIAANVEIDLPVEPAGTVAKPQGGANNGPLWLCLQAQGVSAKVTLTMHQNGKLGAPVSATLAAGGPKGVFSLPTDGSVDFVRITSTAPLIGYLTGRQVA